MSAPDQDHGEPYLEAINAELVALHERYHHRQPVTAKTRLLDGELVACVMGGVYTEVEKTMIELERSQMVKDVRGAFQLAMEHKFIEIVERHSGRQVVSFVSNSHVGPDLEIELFWLAPAVA